MRRISIWLFFCTATFLLLIQSCGINSNLMFKQAKKDVNFDSIPMQPSQEYRISADDKISFTLSTNNGSQILEVMSGVSSEGISRQGGLVEYLVRPDGEVKLPVIGKVKVSGLTVEECEDTLVSKYSKQYRDPFVQVQITNQRVIVFAGNGADAKVIPLTHTNTSLMEALALAGGITERGKANTIKLMRNEDGVRQVYGIDLSTIDGLKYVDMIVQANDYIYVEPSPEIMREVTKDVGTIVSLISSALFIYSAINILK